MVIFEKETQGLFYFGYSHICHFVFFPFLTGPNFHAEISSHNEEIDQEIRSSFHSLNAEIIESIRNNEPSIMHGLFVDEYKNKGIDNIKKLYSQFSPAIEGKTFEVYNEYHIALQCWRPVKFVVSSQAVEDSEFYMFFNMAASNIYVSLLRSEGNFKDVMFSFVYVKANGEWRLCTADIGIFKIGGKTAAELYQESKELSESGYDVPALLRLNVANQFLRPAPFIQYAIEKEAAVLFNKLQTKIHAKHKFPIQFPNIKTNPEIIYVEPQFVQMKMLPMIKYVTKVPFDNVPALQEEVTAITVELESIFSGITKNVSRIGYKAYHELPTDPEKTYECYGLTVEVNQKD